MELDIVRACGLMGTLRGTVSEDSARPARALASQLLRRWAEAAAPDRPVTAAAAQPPARPAPASGAPLPSAYSARGRRCPLLCTTWPALHCGSPRASSPGPGHARWPLRPCAGPMPRRVEERRGGVGWGARREPRQWGATAFSPPPPAPAPGGGGRPHRPRGPLIHPYPALPPSAPAPPRRSCARHAFCRTLVESACQTRPPAARSVIPIATRQRARATCASCTDTM